MTRPRHRPDRRLRGRPDRARATRSASTWRGSTTASARSAPRCSAPSSAASTALVAHRRRRASRTGRATPRRCSSSASLFSALLYAILRLQGHLFLNPDGLAGRPVAHLAEHDGELRHEHELAVLRRRVHDVVPDADGRARGAELRLGGASAWPCSPRSIRGFARRSTQRARQLLGRPLPLARLRPAAALARPRGDPDLAGRRRRPSTAHATATTLEGAQQTIARGPVALADRDQAARDERRRLLQLELGRPVREPERLHELPRAARDPADPGRAGLHVREDGRRACARAGRSSPPCSRCSSIGVGDRLPAEQHGSQVLRDSGVNITAGRRPERRQHGRQGGPLRHRQHRALGGRHDERLERLGQRRPRRAHRRRAAPCRS